MSDLDPVSSNGDLYSVVFENHRVRVLQYVDRPGERTAPHRHPDSVMITQTAFRRRLEQGETSREVELPAALVGWLPAQEHSGANIGDSETRVLFVELKEPDPAGAMPADGIGLLT